MKEFAQTFSEVVTKSFMALQRNFAISVRFIAVAPRRAAGKNKVRNIATQAMRSPRHWTLNRKNLSCISFPFYFSKLRAIDARVEAEIQPSRGDRLATLDAIRARPGPIRVANLFGFGLASLDGLAALSLGLRDLTRYVERVSEMLDVIHDT